MFKSSGPFKQIECPGGSRCTLLNCIFGHHATTAITSLGILPIAQKDLSNEVDVAVSNVPGHSSEEECESVSPPRKRLRRSASIDEPSVDEPPCTVDSNRLKSEAEGVDDRTQSQDKSLEKTVKGQDRSNDEAKARLRVTATPPPGPEIRTQKRPISPPPLKKDKNHGASTDTASAKPSIIVPLKRKREGVKTEILVPRPVPKLPTAHGVRVKLLTLLHEQFSRLDQLVRASTDPWKEALSLSPQELIKAALDEEERAARSNAAVYANVLKLRVTALKKMKFEAWRAERVKQLEKDFPELKKPAAPARLETGLTEQEEISMLPMLVTPQDGLDKHGYVTEDIDGAQIEEARKGLESAQGYEVCDRCATRFQVFPGRREDGVLTTGGECTYHPGRARRPPKEKGRAAEGERYTCCQDVLGSIGCTKAKHHVFKTSSPKRLAMVLPFQRTPASERKHSRPAVCFDCEMGYTTLGMELIRLTVTAWPGERELIDVLVRPLGEVLDLNSTFSGVWPEHFTSALPYAAKKAADSPSGTLRIVESPGAARDLLFQQIGPSTALIGHALENDLNAVRIIHPTIIDTVLLYPHPRGLPLRYGLKYLAKSCLDKDIQMSGARGHDSKEDAIAAGELVRLKVKERWRRMENEGWMVKDGEFIPPKPKER